MAIPQPRPTAAPIGRVRPGTNAVAVRPAPRGTPVHEAWRSRLPVGVFVDAAGSAVVPQADAPAGATSTVSPSDAAWASTVVDHPTIGLAATGLRDVMWNNVAPYNTEIQQSPPVTATWEALTRGGQVSVVAAPYDRYAAAGAGSGGLDDEWFANEAIAHTDAEADVHAQNLVAIYGGHPSVLAYIVRDDVVATNSSGARSATMCRAIQRADPYGRPCSGVYTASSADNYAAFFPPTENKLIVWYYYPCGMYSDGTPTAEGDFHRQSAGDFVATVRGFLASMPAGCRSWMILQAHQTLKQAGFPTDPTNLRYPTPREMRSMVWQAIGEGITGLYWFAYTDGPGGEGTWDGLVSPNSAARLAVAAEMAGRLTPTIRARLLACAKATDAFTASGGGAAFPPPATQNYANAYVSTLYDAAADRRYCVVCNHATATASVALSWSLPGDLVDLATGVRYASGQAVSLPALDGTILWLDQTPGAPHVAFDATDDVQALWDRHWMNPSAPQSRPRAAILLHPTVHVVGPGEFAAALGAYGNHQTYRLRPGVHPRAEIVGYEGVHVVADDPANKPTVNGFPRVFGSTNAMQINGCCDFNDDGWISDMFYWRKEPALAAFLRPKRDFLFRDLNFSNTDGAVCRQTKFLISFNSSLALVSDHWISNTPFWFRNVEDVLIEDCAFDASYLIEDANGLLVGPPIYSDVGYVNANCGAAFVNVRNCAFTTPAPGVPVPPSTTADRRFPNKIFLDGTHGSCLYHADYVGGVAWHVGDTTVFTNDDFSFDTRWDGTRDDDGDARDAHHTIVAFCALGYSPEAFVTFQGHRNLVTDCALLSGGGATQAVQIDARFPNHGGVYRHVGNVVRRLTATGSFARFVAHSPDGGFPPDDVCGQSLVIGNTVTGGTVTAWVADLPGATYASIGPNVVTGNIP